VIRQAISCDVCATEKKQTNHWFVAYEQGGELRVSGWQSRNRLRPGSKHLCGQTCLHKLVDEFMAKAIAVRNHGNAADISEIPERTVGDDTSPMSKTANAEVESSAHLATSPVSAVPESPLRPQPGLVAMPAKPRVETVAPSPDEAPHIASRNWRAEAWERERARELRSVERRSDIAARRRSSA
jgi:hypothetical protein